MDAGDKLDKELLKDKKLRFTKFVKITAKELGVKQVKIAFRRSRCSEDLGNEIAHIHTDTDPPTICIMERWLKALPNEEIERAAVHETAHVIHPEHDSGLYITINKILEKYWQPPIGVQVIDGNAETTPIKPSEPEKPRKNECNYNPCKKKKGLVPCKLCERVFCSQHITPKAPAMFNSEPRTVEDQKRIIEYRKEGHPCLKYYDFEETEAEEPCADISEEEKQELQRLSEEMQKQWEAGQKQRKLDEIAIKKGIPRHWVEEAPERKEFQHKPAPDFESLAKQDLELSEARKKERKEFLPRFKEKPSLWQRIKKLFKK